MHLTIFIISAVRIHWMISQNQHHNLIFLYSKIHCFKEVYYSIFCYNIRYTICVLSFVINSLYSFDVCGLEMNILLLHMVALNHVIMCTPTRSSVFIAAIRGIVY